MSNGEMLLTLKKHAESGKPIEDDLFRSLVLAGIHDQMVSTASFEGRIEDQIKCMDKKIDKHKSINCDQSDTNKDEIDRLRDKSSSNDSLLLIATIIAGVIGAIFGLT